jgi:hypothetical protein
VLESSEQLQHENAVGLVGWPCGKRSHIEASDDLKEQAKKAEVILQIKTIDTGEWAILRSYAFQFKLWRIQQLERTSQCYESFCKQEPYGLSAFQVKLSNFR